jgi:hypothetical protein
VSKRIVVGGVGRRIGQDLLVEGRGSCGVEILPTLSASLVPQYGRGFSVRNLIEE